MTARILVADDQAMNRDLLAARLAPDCPVLVMARDGVEAIERLQAESFDLILLDLQMPRKSGFEVLGWMQTAGLCPRPPVLVLTASGGGLEKAAALALGADDVVTEPVDGLALRARVRALLRLAALSQVLPDLPGMVPTAAEAGGGAAAVSPHGREGDVLLLEPDPAAAAQIARILAHDGHRLHHVTALEQAEAQLLGPQAEVLLISLGPDAALGLRQALALRASPRARGLPMMLLMLAQDPVISARALDLGIHDFLARPYDPLELLARMRMLIRRHRLQCATRARLQDTLALAVRDALTGLHNRRHFDQALLQAVRSRDGGPHPTGLMLLDIDFFKQVNDRHGHAVGDVVLKVLSQRLAAQLREIDVLARIGGEEFALIAPSLPLSSLHALAERLRQKIAEEPVAVRSANLLLPVTVSIGVTILDPAESDGTAALARADRALYAAKAAGRNRIMQALPETLAAIGGR